MQTSYEAWARYDVEKELSRVEEREREEEERRKEARKVQEKRQVEASISLDAEQSAEVLAAHAAVAALKAKGRGRRRGERATGASLPPSNQSEQAAACGVPTPEETACTSVTELSDADTLQRHAERLRKKHELIENIRQACRAGDDLLQSCRGDAADWSAAKEHYERALMSVRELSDVVPELEEAERQADIVRGRHANESSTDGSASPPERCGVREEGCAASDHDHHDHQQHHHDHQHTKGECGCHRSTARTAISPTDHSLSLREKAKDLAGVVDHFHRECFMGIATCELSMGRYAAASEMFKEVLLKDDKHLLAWLQRGRAFEKMNAPLLALLHYTRVISIDASFRDAKACEDRIKSSLLMGREDTVDDHSTDSGVKSLQFELERVYVLLEEANVIMMEAFFGYAMKKYERALLRLQAMCHETNEDSVTAIVRQLMTSCHLNIASCCLELQRHHRKGLEHCQEALILDPTNVVAQFRKAQLQRALHDYAGALTTLEAAKTMAISGDDSERIRLLVAKEIDRCLFDRSQHDLVYLRSIEHQ